MAARCVILPSLPTELLMRANPPAICSFCSKISFSTSYTLPPTPVLSEGKRTEKSPFLKATRALSNSVVFKVLVAADSALILIGPFYWKAKCRRVDIDSPCQLPTLSYSCTYYKRARAKNERVSTRVVSVMHRSPYSFPCRAAGTLDTAERWP